LAEVPHWQKIQPLKQNAMGSPLWVSTNSAALRREEEAVHAERFLGAKLY